MQTSPIAHGCRLLGELTPAEADPEGQWFCFERGASEAAGGEGWADVWKRGHFGWEYKGRRKDLIAALGQLQQYALTLENPPLLAGCVTQVHYHFSALLLIPSMLVCRVFGCIDLDQGKPQRTWQIFQCRQACQSNTEQLRSTTMKRSVTMVGWLLAAAVLLAIVVDVGFAVWGGLATAFSWDRMQATASRLVFLEIVSLLSFLVIPIWLLSRLRRAENGLRTPALKGALVVSVAVAFIVMIATKLSFQDLPDDSLTPSLAVFVGLGFCLPQILLGATFGYVVTLAITLARRRPVLDASNAATLASWVVLSIGLVVPLASTLAPALYYYGASEAFRLGLALLPYVVGLAAISLLPFIIAAEWSSWLVRRYIQGERDLSKFGVLSGAVLALAGETAMLHWSAAMPGSGDLMGMSVLLPLTPLSMKVFAMLIGGVAGYTIVRIATIRMLRPAQAFRTVLAFGLALPLGMAIAAPQLPALLKCLFVLCRPLAGPLALMSNLTDFAIVYGLSLLPFALLAPAVKWLLVHSREAGSPRSALYGGSVSGSVAGVCLVAVLVHWDLWTNPASALDPVFQPLSFLAAHGFGVVAGGLAGALASVRPARVFG